MQDPRSPTPLDPLDGAAPSSRAVPRFIIIIIIILLLIIIIIITMTTTTTITTPSPSLAHLRPPSAHHALTHVPPPLPRVFP